MQQAADIVELGAAGFQLYHGGAHHNNNNNNSNSNGNPHNRSRSPPSKSCFRNPTSLLLLFFCLCMISWNVTLHVQVHQLRSSRSTFATTDQVRSLQEVLQLLVEQQTNTAREHEAKVSQLELTQKATEESLSGKIGTLRTTVSSVQEELRKLDSTVASSEHGLKIQKLESQMDTIRRMYGLGSFDQATPARPETPQERLQKEDAQRQQQQAWDQYASYAYPNGGGGGGAHSLPQQQQQGFNNDPNFAAARAGGPRDRAEVLPDPTKDIQNDAERARARAAIIRAEFEDSWKAYRKYAWGHDELCPNSKHHRDWGGPKSKGTALSAVDALSTLWLLGFHEEFDEAVKLITQFVDYDQPIQMSVFETTIRVVGGLISAYELSGESKEELVETAAYVANKLLYAFNTTTGIPHQTINMKTKEHWNVEWTAGASVLSEIGSIQLEFRALSFHTGDPMYDLKATHVHNILTTRCSEDLMCPTLFDVASGETRSDQVTLGALGDSFFEYLLKQFLYTDGTEVKYKQQALKALESIRAKMLKYSHPSHLAYLAQLVEGATENKMDHLACFAGGMYALAAMTIAQDEPEAALFKKTAAELTATCFEFYDRQITGIAPEIIDFDSPEDFHAGEQYYLLRPETAESIFYMWRATKDEKYRQMQWRIFTHVQKHCKAPQTGAYAGITMTNLIPTEQDDMMQSFWLSETMKYFYLTFVDDHVLDLNQWVLNTEAHPLKIRRRDPMSVWRDWEAAHNGDALWLPPTVGGVSPVETANMLRERMARGDPRIVYPSDPLGYDMRQPDDTDGDNPTNPYDPRENAMARRASRHDAEWHRVKARPAPATKKQQGGGGGSAKKVATSDSDRLQQ